MMALNPVEELQAGVPSANSLTGLNIDEFFTRTDASNNVSTLLTDALGSTIELVGSAQNIGTNYTYQPFGATTVGGAANGSSYEFTGRENDGTGLYFNRARYYSPTFQRFIAQDPIGFAGGDPNLYGYVSNGPTNFSDPLGLSLASIVGCFLKGGALGARGALAVGGIAVGAVALGAPVAVVTAALGVAAIAGGAALGIDVVQQFGVGNSDGVAFDVGSLVVHWPGLRRPDHSGGHQRSGKSSLEFEQRLGT